MVGSLTSNAQMALGGIVALLVLATVGVFVFNRLAPDNGVNDLTPRLRSWWMMVAIFSATMTIGRNASLIFLALISFLALKEYLSLVTVRRTDRSIALWAYLAIPAQYYWLFSGYNEMVLLFVPLYALLFCSGGMVFAGAPGGYLRAVGTVNWGLMIIVFALGHLGFLVALPDAGNPAG